MKKNILLLCVLHFFFNSLFGQSNIVWQRSLGGTGSDAAYSITSTRDNGLICFGATYSTDGDITVSHGNADDWVVKLDSNGITQWKKSYGGSGADFPTIIINTSDSGYIFCGSTTSNDFDITFNHGLSDFWVVKTDSLGTIEWQKTYGGTQDERADCILQTNDNGYMVCGVTRSNDGDVTGNHGYGDVWVFKIDSIGNIIWQKCYGGTGWEIAHSIKATNDGGFIVGCNSSSNDGDVSGNHGFDDIWIFKIDTIGNLIWQNSFGGSWMENQADVIQDSGGSYYVTGFTGSNNGDVTTAYGFRDGWLIKLDSVGNLLWQKSYGGSAEDEFWGILLKNSNEILIAGLTSSNDIDVSGNHGSDDGWLLKLDSSGNVISQKCFGGTLHEAFLPLQFNLSGYGLFVAGRNTSIDGDVIGNQGGADFWILKLAPDTISGVQTQLQDKTFNIAPNPFSSIITIAVPKQDCKNISIVIYDMLGKIVFKFKDDHLINPYKKSIDLNALSQGIFFLEVTVDGEKTVSKIVKQ